MAHVLMSFNDLVDARQELISYDEYVPSQPAKERIFSVYKRIKAGEIDVPKFSERELTPPAHVHRYFYYSAPTSETAVKGSVLNGLYLPADTNIDNFSKFKPYRHHEGGYLFNDKIKLGYIYIIDIPEAVYSEMRKGSSSPMLTPVLKISLEASVTDPNYVPGQIKLDPKYITAAINQKTGKVIKGDNAQVMHANKTNDLGGIDLNPADKALQVQNQNGEIKFKVDPAMLQQLQNAPGFVPVVISIQPMKNLAGFLGLDK